MKWKLIDNKRPENSWVELQDLFCFDLVKKFIQMQLAIPECSFRELLLDALDYVRMRSEIYHELGEKVEEIKVGMSSWAAEKVSSKNKVIAEIKKKAHEEEKNAVNLKRKYDASAFKEKFLDDENRELKKRNEALIAEKNELHTQVAQMKQNLLDVRTQFQKKQEENVKLSEDYEKMCEYVSDQQNVIKYINENPFGKVPLPQLPRDKF